jgi:hypothetical protein
MPATRSSLRQGRDGPISGSARTSLLDQPPRADIGEFETFARILLDRDEGLAVAVAESVLERYPRLKERRGERGGIAKANAPGANY